MEIRGRGGWGGWGGYRRGVPEGLTTNTKSRRRPEEAVAVAWSDARLTAPNWERLREARGRISAGLGVAGEAMTSPLLYPDLTVHTRTRGMLDEKGAAYCSTPSSGQSRFSLGSLFFDTKGHLRSDNYQRNTVK